MRPWLRECLRTERDELLDREPDSPRAVRTLDELAQFDRRIGWNRAHVAAVSAWWRHLGRPRPFRVADVGAGTGGLFSALATWAEAERVPVVFTGIDHNPTAIARAQGRPGPAIEWLCLDARDLGDHRFDLGVTTLTLHHLPPALRHEMLSELDRVCAGVYAFDLVRTVRGTLAAAFLLRGLGLGRDAASDGLISMRRACTADEFRTLVAATLPATQIRRVHPAGIATWPRD